MKKPFGNFYEMKNGLSKLSVVIPAHNEDGCISSTVKHLYVELSQNTIPHEIIVVDDGSHDHTGRVLNKLRNEVLTLRILRNKGLHGFGRAVAYGLDRIEGDAAVIMMADESDDCRDVIRYWKKLNEGYDCVFGSRFVKGAGVVDYPLPKLILNRIGNKLLQSFFGIKCNDITNAFKAYRKNALEGCKPLLSRHFNLTVELPLKAVVRGYKWAVVPISWHNRQSGLSKFQIKEMGSRYLFSILYVWLENFLCRTDYLVAKRRRTKRRLWKRQWMRFKRYIRTVFHR